MITTIEEAMPVEEDEPWQGKHASWKDSQGGSPTSTPTALSETMPPLLSLPSEIRQRIFGFVFSCHDHDLPKTPGDYLSAVVLCRQIHNETRLLPFQLNRVHAPATFESNATSTIQFLNRLGVDQRQAIRSLDVRMLASLNEAWSLRSILSLLIEMDEGGTRAKGEGVVSKAGSEKQLETWREHDKSSTESFRKSDLRQLNIHISTCDLLLPQANSYVGLMHWLAVASSPSTDRECGTWVTEGLVQLPSLRKLTIVVEMSASVAKEVTLSERAQFQRTVRDRLPWVSDVEIQWEVRANMILGVDDPEWENFSPSTEVAEPIIGQGQIQQNEDRVRPKAGFTSWLGVAA